MRSFTQTRFHVESLLVVFKLTSTYSKPLLGKLLLSSGGVLKQKASKSMNAEFLHVERRTGSTVRVNEAKPQRPLGNTHQLVS